MSTEAESFDPTDARRERGRAIAALCKIGRDRKTYLVPSQTGNGTYRITGITTESPRCDCPDFEKRGQPCKHVFAVRFVLDLEERGDGFVSGDQAVALMIRVKAPRPTYKQDWPAYNAAQTNEKHKFQVLLHELCKGIQEPPRPAPKGKGGRPRLSIADMVFAATFKIFSTVSARRFACDLKDAHERGYLDRLPHFNSVLNYLEDPALTPILKQFIAKSSSPLRSIEADFAVDSSGFTSSRFVRWFDHKYGKPMQEHDWVKVSVMTGVKTNVVTAVEVDERYAADCPQFAPLARKTAENFTLREVSADAAYLSYENMDLISGLGGTPYILFKSNTTASGGGVFEKMFHLYNLNRDDYLTHYHKRSNVESTFSMIKAKFGDSLRSKSDAAMVNEALCKILAHNLCCLIQSHYELGIEAKFWGEAEKLTDVVGAPVPTDLTEAWAWV